jgi:DNA-binding NarL/FixJ family response regulator
MIRVVVADDQALVRGGFRSMLDRQDDIEVVGEAADGSEALMLVEATSPDVVCMDIRMPNLDGIETTRRIAQRNEVPRILILTTFDADRYVYDALLAGAAGFLLKDSPPELLVTAVRTVAAGEELFAPSVTRRLVESYVNQPPPGSDRPTALAALTERELDVLREIAAGRSNIEIGQQLYLSEATVKSHVTHILTKLRLRDRVQAVVLAYELGLVRPGRAISTAQDPDA